MNNGKIVGLYGDPATVANHPDFLDVAQGEIGLNRIIFGGPVNLSAETRALNPFTGRTDGMAPGVMLTNDDTILRKAIDEAHRRELQVWAITSWYWAGAENAPELMARDLYGRRMDEIPRSPYAHEQSTQTFCPTNQRANAWFQAALVDIVSRYDFQGTALTHFRYCHPAFFEQMLACGCPSCQETAAELGYDFPRMKKAMLNTVTALQCLPAKTIRVASQHNFGFTDLLLVLGQDAAGVIDWFNFRADVLSHNLKQASEAVHAAAGPDFAFGSDIHYPSMAMLVGQRYRDFAASCEQILPLLSHNEIHFLDNLASFATLLRQWSGADEAECLRLVYRLFGLDDPRLPPTVTEMHMGEPLKGELSLEILPDLIAGEMRKARLYAGESVRSYPVIKGGWWPPATVRSLIDAAEQAGQDGIVFQGTDSLFTYQL